MIFHGLVFSKPLRLHLAVWSHSPAEVFPLKDGKEDRLDCAQPEQLAEYMRPPLGALQTIATLMPSLDLMTPLDEDPPPSSVGCKASLKHKARHYEPFFCDSDQISRLNDVLTASSIEALVKILRTQGPFFTFETCIQNDFIERVKNDELCPINQTVLAREGYVEPIVDSEGHLNPQKKFSRDRAKHLRQQYDLIASPERLSELQPIILIEPLLNGIICRNLISLTARCITYHQAGTSTPLQQAGFQLREEGANSATLIAPLANLDSSSMLSNNIIEFPFWKRDAPLYDHGFIVMDKDSAGATNNHPLGMSSFAPFALNALNPTSFGPRLVTSDNRDEVFSEFRSWFTRSRLKLSLNASFCIEKESRSTERISTISVILQPSRLNLQFSSSKAAHKCITALLRSSRSARVRAIDTDNSYFDQYGNIKFNHLSIFDGHMELLVNHGFCHLVRCIQCGRCFIQTNGCYQKKYCSPSCRAQANRNKQMQKCCRWE